MKYWTMINLLNNDNTIKFRGLEIKNKNNCVILKIYYKNKQTTGNIKIDLFIKQTRKHKKLQIKIFLTPKDNTKFHSLVFFFWWFH